MNARSTTIDQPHLPSYSVRAKEGRTWPRPRQKKNKKKTAPTAETTPKPRMEDFLSPVTHDTAGHGTRHKASTTSVTPKHMP